MSLGAMLWTASSSMRVLFALRVCGLVVLQSPHELPWPRRLVVDQHGPQSSQSRWYVRFGLGQLDLNFLTETGMQVTSVA